MRAIHRGLAVLAYCLVMTAPSYGADFYACNDAESAPGLKGSLCAYQQAPMAGVSGGETISLFIRKFPAPGPAKGSLWLIAGGPGESGASLYDRLPTVRRSFPDFDLLLPDHRGTGFSSRLCPREEAPDSPGGTGLVGAEWGSCFAWLANHPQQARQYSITNAAADLALLLKTYRGNQPTYLYGVSYGTQLILRTLQLGPAPVQGIILDSLVPRQSAAAWELSRRSHVLDDVGRKVLAQCDANADCHAMLGKPAAAALRDLLSKAALTPALVETLPGRDLKRFLGNLLDVPAARARIPALILSLAQGRHGELDAVLADLMKAQASLGNYPQMQPSIPLVALISAAENNLRPELTLEQVEREEAGLLFTSSLPSLMVKPAVPLYARDRYFDALPAALPPTLVLHGTLDPKTHYEGALDHAAALRRLGALSLVSVSDAPHFILWTAPGCFTRHVKAFVDGQRALDQTCPMLVSEP